MKIFFTELWGRTLTPERVRPYLKQYLLKAGILAEPYSFFGTLWYFSLFTTILIYVMYLYPWIKSLQGEMPKALYPFFMFSTTISSFALVCFTLIAFIIICIYFYLDMSIFNRTRHLEEILPDFLSMVSSNLKGGLSFEKSLWMSIKPRFGILATEIAIAAKKVMTGHDIEVALNEFGEKYDSPMLKRSLNLIVSEIASGGKVSDIIDDISENLKKTRLLKEEMSASVITYMIFIAAVVIVISPVLYSLSYNLLKIIVKVTGLLSQSMGTSTSVIQVKPIDFDPIQFKYFSHICIGVVALCSSMIVSIIEKGNVKGGIKYIPIFFISSQIIYVIAFAVMEVVFGALIQF